MLLMLGFAGTFGGNNPDTNVTRIVRTVNRLLGKTNPCIDGRYQTFSAWNPRRY